MMNVLSKSSGARSKYRSSSLRTSVMSPSSTFAFFRKTAYDSGFATTGCCSSLMTCIGLGVAAALAAGADGAADGLGSASVVCACAPGAPAATKSAQNTKKASDLMERLIALTAFRIVAGASRLPCSKFRKTSTTRRSLGEQCSGLRIGHDRNAFVDAGDDQRARDCAFGDDDDTAAFFLPAAIEEHQLTHKSGIDPDDPDEIDDYSRPVGSFSKTLNDLGISRAVELSGERENSVRSFQE